jgi:hypothetical protein
VVLTTANFGGLVISAGTMHDLRRVKVPGTSPLLTIVVNSEHFITSKHGGHGFLAETIPGKPLKRKVTQEETREWKKQYEKE